MSELAGLDPSPPGTIGSVRADVQREEAAILRPRSDHEPRLVGSESVTVTVVSAVQGRKNGRRAASRRASSMRGGVSSLRVCALVIRPLSTGAAADGQPRPTRKVEPRTPSYEKAHRRCEQLRSVVKVPGLTLGPVVSRLGMARWATTRRPRRRLSRPRRFRRGQGTAHLRRSGQFSRRWRRAGFLVLIGGGIGLRTRLLCWRGAPRSWAIRTRGRT